MAHKTRKLVKPAHLNSQNALFGGELLKWIDEEIGIFAMHHLETKGVATKIIPEIDFKSPAFQGDMIEIGVEVAGYGSSSLTLQVEVFNLTTKKTILSLDKVVMVSVSENYKPILHGKSFQPEKN
jgi:acyl-CoA hydrolase